MKSKYYLLALLLLMPQAWAQNDNRGRAKPNYNPTNLTDAERKESETFVHEGKTQRVMMQECAGLSDAESKLFQENPQKAYEQFGDKLNDGMKTCQGQAEVKGMGLSPEMAGAISKAYTMVMGVAGGGLKLKSLDQVAEQKENQATRSMNRADKSLDKVQQNIENERKAIGTDDFDHLDNKTGRSLDRAGRKVDRFGDKVDDEIDAKDKAREGKDERDDTDYCKYVAVGTEAIAMVQQTMAQDQMNSVPLDADNSAQRAAIMRVSRGYKERSKNAQTQTMGWGVTTGCYAAMMVRPSVSKSAWQNWLKVGASGFLTLVYHGQQKGFEDAANKTKKVAEALPGAGDCNPHTDRDCYCSEPTTMNNPTYCAPYLHQNTIRDPGITLRTSCITNQAKADPKCQCLSDDSCLSTGIDSMLKLDGLGGQVNPALLSDLNSLSNGSVPSSLNSAALSRNLSAARNAMRKADEELKKLTPPKTSLNPGEIKEAEFLEAQGVPSTLAKAIASSPLEGNDAKATLASFQSSFAPAQKPKSSSFNASLVDSRSASGLRPKRAAKKEAAVNPFAKYMNKGKGSSTPSGTILNLAQKAEASAQISNRKESSVFEIISRRYQVSAWRRLELSDQDL